MLKEYLKLGKYIKIQWKYFVLGMIFMILSVISNGVSLSTTVPLLDKILSGKKIILPESLPSFIKFKISPFIFKINSLHPLLLLKYLIFFILGVIFLKGLFYYFNNYFFRIFGARILTDLRDRIYTKITRLSLEFFTKKQTGEITTRIVYDVNLLNSALVHYFPQIIFQSFLALIYMIIIFTIDWKLSTISLLIFPPLLIPVFKIGKKLRKLGRKIQEIYGKVGNVINESIYGQKIIKAYNLEKTMVEKFRKENENIFRVILSITKRILVITPFTEIMGAIGASGLIYFGAKKVIEGTMSPGFLFLFFAALFSAISPMKGIGIAFLNLKHASSALPRIFSVLNTEEKVKDTGREIFEGIREKIEFRNVSFSYEDKKILNDINLTVKKGEKIGIVGPTGAGKTTLVGLLLRFYDPVSGEILIDGKNIKEFTLSSLRKHVGFVPQEPILFHDTIKSNITFKNNVDEERLKKVIEIAGLEEFIENLPDKLETVIGERGTTLSGGQKQLISVARATYKNPEILIFDEATASLDSQSEKVLQEALERVMEKRTVFIIAHRLSTLRNVDRIIVLKDGKIFEEGTHKQLYEKKGLYYKLWQLQFQQQ